MIILEVTVAAMLFKYACNSIVDNSLNSTLSPTIETDVFSAVKGFKKTVLLPYLLLYILTMLQLRILSIHQHQLSIIRALPFLNKGSSLSSNNLLRYVLAL